MTMIVTMMLFTSEKIFLNRMANAQLPSTSQMTTDGNRNMSGDCNMDFNDELTTENSNKASTTFFTSEDAISPIATSLEGWGCCVWCVLRFLGYKLTDDFKLSEEEALQKYGLKGLAESLVCVACVGLLRNSDVDNIIEIIKRKLDASSRQFTSYTAYLTLPLAVILREHAILVLLRDNYPHVYTSAINKDKVISLKSVWKIRFADLIGLALCVPLETTSPFEVRIQFSGEDIERECNFLKTVSSALQGRKVNAQRDNRLVHLSFNQTNVAKALSQLSDEVFKYYYQCPPKALSQPCRCKTVQLNHASIFVAGRYNKYTRAFGQTPWFVQGEQKIDTSVEQTISPYLLDQIKPSDHKFMASGREDVDVRMLGRGRPFMFEFINPRFVNWTKEDLARFQKTINSSTELVKVHHLQIVTKEDGANIKEGENEKTKRYAALVWCKDTVTLQQVQQLEQFNELKVNQTTPIRVLHRRSHSVREKVIHSMSVRLIDEHHLKLCLVTQAGTYVKEFVHGDFGRTLPNLGTLLNTECDILALDVEEIILDWPKPVDDDHDEEEASSSGDLRTQPLMS